MLILDYGAVCNIWLWFTRTSTSTHLTTRGLNASSLRSIQFNRAQIVLSHPRAILCNNTADLLSTSVADPIRSSRNRGNLRKLDRAYVREPRKVAGRLPHDKMPSNRSGSSRLRSKLKLN